MKGINVNKLVIVESPSKSKTIEKYLGSGYKVLSSKGHIRDLSTTDKYGFGVDLENDFKPDYKIISGKNKLVSSLKKEAKECDEVLLATDPDREGEAISWHLKDVLKLKDKSYGRVVFNEITKNAIVEAFKNPRKIDEDLVHSQETRRILDRIIGFRLSKLMQSKTEGKSAGRVQSVALKIIVDREKEINAFNKEEYWTLETIFDEFSAFLDKYKDKKLNIKNEKEVDDIIMSLSDEYVVESIESKETLKNSKAPFTTSTLTQMASNRLGFSASKTMKIAQKLYEGIKIDEGYTGLITYMRTDSIRLSDEFVKSTQAYIYDKYGKEYVGYAKKSNKTENVQDAHEAIRCTSINRSPNNIKQYLSNDEYKLYNLIFVRTLSSLMASAKVNSTLVQLNNNDYIFKATGNVLIFDGYLKIYASYEQSEDVILPDLKDVKVLSSNDLNKEQHFTQPPSRYNEASLIKTLEKLGIGRPSTYAKIIDILVSRKYIVKDKKKFIPTSVGITMIDKLEEFFSQIINVEYTAQMETDLDKVAEGTEVWYELLDKFYKEFEPLVQNAFTKMEKAEPEKVGKSCPMCGADLVYRNGRYGKFAACSGYPNCKYILKEEKQKIEVMPCPKCDGTILEKTTKRGKTFYGCSNYPKCDYASWFKPVATKCKTCGENLVIKNDKEICPSCTKEEN